MTSMEHRRFRLLMDLEDFAEGRKGWAMKGEDPNRYAGRVFDFGRRGQILLSVQLAHDVRPPLGPFVAQINLQFSAGPEESTAGRLRDIESWLSRRERLLALPVRLGECRTAAAAEVTCGEVSAKDVVLLAFFMEIEGDLTEIRRTLIREYGPKAGRS